MKNGKFILAIFLFLNSTAHGQIEIIPTGTNKLLNQIEISGDHVYISGNDYLAKCTGMCDSLIVLSSPVSAHHYLNVIDTNIMFLLHYRYMYSGINRSVVYKSTDGGKNWGIVFDNNSGNIYFTLTMFDSLEGILTGMSFSMSGGYAPVMRTTDGGNTWEGEAEPFIHSLSAAKFQDSIVLIGGTDKSCYSENRGRTWNCTAFEKRWSIDGRFEELFFLNKDTIFSLSLDYDHFLSYTFNKGTNWDYSLVKPHDTLFYPFPEALYFLNMQEGYFLVFDRILKTTDLGNTWLENNTNLGGYFTDIKFLNDSIALICGSGGTLFRWNKNANPFYPVSVPKTNAGVPAIKVFPNPSGYLQSLQIIANTNEEVSVELFDLQGRLVKTIYKGKPLAVENIFSVDFSALAAGVYYYRIMLGDKYYFQKTVKH